MAMGRTSRIERCACMRRLNRSAVFCLILFWVPYCTAESGNLPSAPLPSRLSAMIVPNTNVSEAGRDDTVPSKGRSGAKANSGQTSGTVPSENGQTEKPSAQTTGQTPTSGVAAAPDVNSQGVSGSEPAGAAIAPAKQRRRRIFALRIGLMVGAAIAIGTVVALSKVSPSRSN